MERRKQARLLMSREVLLSPQLKHPRLIIGDFNEWTRGLVSKTLQHSFESVDIQLHLNRKRTYPGVLPIMHLDHMYFDRELALEEFCCTAAAWRCWRLTICRWWRNFVWAEDRNFR